ncbi:hypothetical protein VKT23_020424 [Stygiomarasmius scandens]|uniref:Uncharacterized protein n=1 Tax=Marasmiellus scandens TaxID=2682957 RepID=A0ABR1IKY4_9AGAR
MPKRWLSAEQEAFLKSQVAAFDKARLSRTLDTEFRPKLWNEWFGKYETTSAPPLTAPAIEHTHYGHFVVKRKKQIDSFFYNDLTKRLKTSTVTKKSVDTILEGKGSKSRSLSAVQTFSKDNYSAVIKPAVDRRIAEMKAQSVDGKLKRGAHLPVIKQVTQDLFDALGDEAKGEFVQKASKAREEKMKPVDTDGVDKDFVANMEGYIVNLANRVHQKSGFACSILVGGFTEATGEIVIYVHHAGEDIHGLPFCDANPDYPKHWTDKFTNFVVDYHKAELNRAGASSPFDSSSQPAGSSIEDSPSNPPAIPSLSPPLPSTAEVFTRTGVIPMPPVPSLPFTMIDPQLLQASSPVFVNPAPAPAPDPAPASDPTPAPTPDPAHDPALAPGKRKRKNAGNSVKSKKSKGPTQAKAKEVTKVKEKAPIKKKAEPKVVERDRRQVSKPARYRE